MTESLNGVVVALDDADLDDIIGALEVMVQEGLHTFAVHVGSDFAALASIFGARARLGVHRVRTAEQASQAITAGASFVLPDLVDDAVLAACEAVATYPMAMTPAEVQAVQAKGFAGAQVVPADSLGPSYADFLAELGLAEQAVPRGSLGAYAMGCWLTAGAQAVIADTQLLMDALTGGDLGQLRDRCSTFVSVQQ